MGVQQQDRDAIYENCPYSRSQRSPSPPAALTSAMLPQRQPPPYPGHSIQVYADYSDQPGFRQSYSGSSDTSTDMSLSSTENLAAWPRQDPQGEENYGLYVQLDENSILARLQASSSSSSCGSSSTVTTSCSSPPATGCTVRPGSGSVRSSNGSSPSSCSLGYSSASCTHLQSMSSQSCCVGFPSVHSQSLSSSSSSATSTSGGVGGVRMGIVVGEEEVGGSEMVGSTNNRHNNQHLTVPLARCQGFQAVAPTPSHSHQPLPHPASLPLTPTLPSHPQSAGRQCARSVTPNTYHHPHPYVNWTPGQSCSVSQQQHHHQQQQQQQHHQQQQQHNQQQQYLQQHQQSPRVVSYVPYLPPPPVYPGHKGGERREQGLGGSGGRERCVMGSRVAHGRSQPDLSRLAISGNSNSHSGAGVSALVSSSSSSSSTSSSSWSSASRRHGEKGGGQSRSYVNSDLLFSSFNSGSSGYSSQGSVDHLTEILHEENSRLQEELVDCYKRIAKLQKIEQEMQMVHKYYVSLVRSTEKRDRLETAIKTKLQDEVKKLQSENEELKAQLNHSTTSSKKQVVRENRGALEQAENVGALRKRLNEKDTEVEQLGLKIIQLEQQCAELENKSLMEKPSTVKSSSSGCPAERLGGSETGNCRQPSLGIDNPLLPGDDNTTASQTVSTPSDTTRVEQLEAEVKWLQAQMPQYARDASCTQIYRHTSLLHLPQDNCQGVPPYPPPCYPHSPPASPALSVKSCPSVGTASRQVVHKGHRTLSDSGDSIRPIIPVTTDGHSTCQPSVTVNSGDGKTKVQLWQV